MLLALVLTAVLYHLALPSIDVVESTYEGNKVILEVCEQVVTNLRSDVTEVQTSVATAPSRIALIANISSNIGYISSLTDCINSKHQFKHRLHQLPRGLH